MQLTVIQGESAESIAYVAGHVWQTLWDHRQNADLRKRRKSPHVLHPGDVVFVPPLELRTEVLTTGRQHTFRRRDVPSKLRVRFLLDGKPRASVDYTFLVDGQERTGRTHGDGLLEEPVHPLARRAEVRFGPHDVYRFELRHLDPTSEVSGAQGRLHLLGYGVGEIDGEMNEATRDALRAFQEDHGLHVTGELDEATQAKLAEYFEG